MASDPITSWQIEGEKVEVVADFIFLGSKITADGDCSHENRRRSLLESDDKPRQCVEKQTLLCWHSPYNQGGLPSGHIRLWELDHKNGRAPKNWCLQTVVLKKTPENPLDRKEVKTVNLKGNQPWIFIERTDAEAPILWAPDAKSRLTGKDPDAGNN